MSRRLTSFSLGALSLLLGLSTYAQASNLATVPFGFTAGNVELPAGDYLIQQKAENDFISITDVKSGKVVFAAAAERQSLPMDAPARLIFRCYGNQHFLSAVWTGGGSARVFSLTAQERQSRAHMVMARSAEGDTREIVAQK